MTHHSRSLLSGFVLAMAALLAAPSVEADTPGAPNGNDATSISIKLRFFDEQGNELSHADVVKRMTNGRGSSILSDGTFDLDTLKAVSVGSSYNGNGRWTTLITRLGTVPRQGIEVHWSTVSTGYSTFLLDNEGQGFKQSETFIFNERLAYDARRQFNAAVQRRADYQPTSAFNQLSNQIDACFVQLGAATTASDKGRIGQSCVDLLAQGMTLMLREYGSQRAKALGQQAVWGVTIYPQPENPVSADLAKIDDLADLFAPQHRWARIQMDGAATDQFPRIREMVNYASSRGVHTLGQLFDSSTQANLTLSEFKDAVDEALSYPDFDEFTAWEVGNEVNGGWLPSNISQRIEYAASRVKALYPQKRTCLTLYWYSMQDTTTTSLFNWIAAKVTSSIKNNIDCVTTSIYIDQQPLGFSWDMVQSKIAEIFPGKSVMVGELGFRDPGVTMYYKEGPLGLSIAKGTDLYIQNRYPAAFATPGAIGGGFWWYYDNEMAGKTARWQTLRNTYCGIYPALCSP